MRVVVLGAGVVGVCTAWFLAMDGHEVEVIERASGAARETSFANGGQISVSQSEPWAHMGAPWQILHWLCQQNAPLLFRPGLDPLQWRWLLRFLRECLPGRFEYNMRQMLALGQYSRQTLDALRQEMDLAFHHQSRGILTLLESQKALDVAGKTCKAMQAFGINKQLVSRETLLALEPSLAPFAARLAGAAWCPDDQSGDVHLFTSQLAAMAATKGVVFRYNTRVNALEHDGSSLTGVSVTQSDGQYAIVMADVYVLALGSYSPLLARTAGLYLPIYPAKGYSATLTILQPDLAPEVSLTDEAHKIVLSRLGNRLRIAGTAELSGYSSHLDAGRCACLVKRVRQWFADDCCDWEQPLFWSGLRPSTPGNVPLIGRSRLPNLYLNTGHGTLGFTEGPGSGRALAEIISGRGRPIDFGFVGV